METNFIATLLLLEPVTVLLYAGPDQILPLASLLGTIIGVLLIGWQRIIGFVKGTFQTLKERRRSSANK